MFYPVVKYKIINVYVGPEQAVFKPEAQVWVVSLTMFPYRANIDHLPVKEQLDYYEGTAIETREIRRTTNLAEAITTANKLLNTGYYEEVKVSGKTLQVEVPQS